MDPDHFLNLSSEGRARVQRLLSLVEGPLPDADVETVLSSSLLVGLPTATALSTAISVFTRTHECAPRQFVTDVLRPTIRVASRFSSVFSLPHTDTGERRLKSTRTEGDSAVTSLEAPTISIDTPSAAFSREQLWCIVANAFLCTFEERDALDELPSINFTEMHRARRRRNYVEITKLRLLFDYFQHLAVEEDTTERADWTAPAVTVVRSQAPSLQSVLKAAKNKTVLPCTVHKLGESIDDQHAMLRLDFANRWIGGGALSDGCVQEEVTFAQCPELIALRWFHRALGDREALVVSGHRQYSGIRTGTYGRDIRYGGSAGMPQRLAGALVAVDALDFRYRGTQPQFTPTAVTREVEKLLGGLLAPLSDQSRDVAGGNWGCGVFGGDVQLKFLIQWLACGLSGKHLHYFPFDLPYVEGMQPVVDYLAQSAPLPLTVLAECLLDAEWLTTASQSGAWTAFMQWLASAKGINVPVDSSSDDDDARESAVLSDTTSAAP